MRQPLTPDAISHIGHQYKVHAHWARLCTVTAALFGPGVSQVTLSMVDVSEADHMLHAVQMVATDPAGQVLPYDFTTAWWAPLRLTAKARVNYATAHLTDLASSVGAAFTPDIRAALRALCEEQLGVEFLQQWQGAPSLTWSFDCQTPPPLTTQPIYAATGAALDSTALIQAGREYAAYQPWAQIRHYVQTLYGPRAATAEIIFFSRYNDSSYDRDVRLVVRAPDGERIYYDLRLPWWQRYHFSEGFIANYNDNHEGESQKGYEEYDAADLDYYENERIAVAQNDVRRLAQMLLRADFGETPESLESDIARYDFTTPPPLTYPQLWQDQA